MKILMISPYSPWPLHVGSSVRIFNILKELSLRGHDIYLLEGRADLSSLPNDQLQTVCKKIYAYQLPKEHFFAFMVHSIFSWNIYPARRFQSKAMTETLDIMLSEQQIDMVWVNFSILAQLLPFNLHKKIPVVLDQHECERLVYQGYFKNGTFKEKLFALINIVKLKRFEQQVFSKISAMLCVSKVEAGVTQNQIKNNVPVWVVPNGVDESFFPLGGYLQPMGNLIVLCANMNVRRNVDAAVWFAKYIFPKIKQQIPGAQFWIVGSKPTKEVMLLNTISGIRVTGTVDDIKSYYRQGNVFVAPYRFGAGTKLKILEAMAIGVPVVSTAVGCQGIEVIDGKHILIAGDETDFSNKVVALLSDLNKAQHIATAAKDLVKNKYLWKEIVDDLESKIITLLPKN